MSLHKWNFDSYQPLFRKISFDWCASFEENKPRNYWGSPILKIVFDSIKATNPSLLHKCPYVGLHGGNFSISKSLSSIAMPGMYKLIVDVKSDIDANVLSLSVMIEFK